MVAFAGPIGSAIASIGASAIGSLFGGDDPQTTATKQRRQDTDLTEALIRDSLSRIKDPAKPGKPSEAEWLRVTANAAIEWERAARRRNPNLPEGIEIALADLKKRSKHQMEARIEDKQFGMEA
tara:strand:+ start:167 stop:538 length:372 start_codon:yes stop_codon:yes gene_type:complete